MGNTNKGLVNGVPSELMDVMDCIKDAGYSPEYFTSTNTIRFFGYQPFSGYLDSIKEVAEATNVCVKNYWHGGDNTYWENIIIDTRK